MLPLDGVRILAIEQYGAGPWATLHLADLGAEVIKIEDPATGGDVARYVPPYAGHKDSIYFQSLNRNKKSVSIDLKSEGGVQLFRQLVTSADGVFNNLRGDVPARLGIDFAALKSVKPGIVCCSLSSFGRQNFRSREPGYDYIMQAYSGWMSITGEPDGPPTKSGLSLVDLSAGILASLGMVASILRARETGVGCDVDVSLFDTAFSELTYVGAWCLSAGYEPSRTHLSSHPSQVPSQIFPTANGHLAIMCAKEKFWVELCNSIERPELLEDTRFQGFPNRLENRHQLVQILIETFTQHETSYWLDRLRGRVPCGPVNSVAEGLADPLVRENDLVIEVDHPEFGVVRQLATAIKVSSGKMRHQRAPALGQDTDAVLEAILGMGRREIAALRADGVIGPTPSPRETVSDG